MRVIEFLFEILMLYWLQGKLDIMVESACKLVSSWQGLTEIGGGSADIRVDDYIRSFTSTVISKMMFGSH